MQWWESVVGLNVDANACRGSCGFLRGMPNIDAGASWCSSLENIGVLIQPGGKRKVDNKVASGNDWGGVKAYVGVVNLLLQNSFGASVAITRLQTVCSETINLAVHYLLHARIIVS